MTLPFENDTSKIIKRISNKSLNSNHKRNLFTILTIALASALLSAITNFLSRKQEIGMLQAIGLSKKQLIKMLRHEGLIYSAFAMFVTLVLGTGLGFVCVQVCKSMNPYFFYSFP